jgi:lysozyme
MPHILKLRRTTVTAVTCALCMGCATKPGEMYSSLDKPVPGIFLDSDRAALPEGFTVRPVSSKGLTLTKESEGFVPRLYNDPAGYCTVGYGHLIKKRPCDGTEPAQFRPDISSTQATDLLIEDMAQAKYAVMTRVRQSGRLSEGQYASLVDFAFNVGAANFARSSLLRLVNSRRFHEIPREWTRWILAGGKVYPGLVRRRQREIELFFDGTPPQLRDGPPEGQATRLIDIRHGEQ